MSTRYSTRWVCSARLPESFWKRRQVFQGLNFRDFTWIIAREKQFSKINLFKHQSHGLQNSGILMSSGIVRPSPQFPELSNKVIVSLTWVSDISVMGGGGRKWKRKAKVKELDFRKSPSSYLIWPTRASCDIVTRSAVLRPKTLLPLALCSESETTKVDYNKSGGERVEREKHSLPHPHNHLSLANPWGRPDAPVPLSYGKHDWCLLLACKKAAWGF